MVTLNIAHEINFLSLSDHMDILKTGSVNVNGRSYSVQSCGSEGVIRLKQTDLAHASFLTRFISSVREFFTGEKKQLEHTINVMKQHSLNIDKVRAKIAELASPAGTVSQPLYAKIEDLAKEMGELNDRGMTQLKFKSAQLADLIDIYSECYPHAVMMDNEMPGPAPKNKSALTGDTLSKLNDCYLNIKNDFETFINGEPGERTLQNLAEEAGQLKQRSDCYASFVNILDDVSNAVGKYYADNFGLMGCADEQIHSGAVKSGPGGIDKKLLKESLERTQNIVKTIAEGGKKAAIEKLNEEITNVLPGAKDGKDVSASDAIFDIRNHFATAKDYIKSIIPKTTETVLNRIAVIINDYGLEGKILKYSGLGDELYDLFQNGKNELIQGLRDGNVKQIEKGIDTCDRMKGLLEAKFAAAEKFDTLLRQSKELVTDCYFYILQGSQKDSPEYKVGFNELYLNFDRPRTAPLPKQKIALIPDEQKKIYGLLDNLRNISNFLDQERLTELKIKARPEDIVKLNEELIKESEELKEAFENVKNIVTSRYQDSVVNVAHDITPNPVQSRASILESIKENLIETLKIQTQNAKLMKIRGESMSEVLQRINKAEANAQKFVDEAIKSKKRRKRHN